MAIDQAKLDEFLGRFVADLGAAFHAPAVVAGDKLGLYQAMAGAGPLTPAELAARTGTSRRYVRDWLRNQAAGGYVDYDPATGRYTLTAEQAIALTDESSPAYVAGGFQIVTAVVKDEPRITEAFRTGGGMGWGEHDADLYPGHRAVLPARVRGQPGPAWIPALDGVGEKLAAGARVADVGCGHGASTIILAKAYPRSSFVGFDSHAPSIERARKAAAEAGVATGQLRGRPADDYPGDGYDLVAFFDSLHDMGDPLAAARTPAGRWPPTARCCWSSRRPATGSRTT